MKKLVVLWIGLLPASRTKNLLLSRLCGFDVSPSARIGPVLLLGLEGLEVGAGTRIEPLNVFRRIPRVSIGARVVIGSFNWFSSAPFLVEASTSDQAGSLVIGEAASVTSRHYVDASGGVLIGRFTTVAGVRSTLMTHYIDCDSNRMKTAPIEVGEYAMVGSNAKLVPGARVPDRSIVAMGSTVVPGLTQSGWLYAGAPAAAKRVITEGGYFERQEGPVPA